jgi:hypothetical protein
VGQNFGETLCPETDEAVEKVGFFEENVKLRGRKCLVEPRKSFVELPGAIQYMQDSCK